MLCNPFRDTHLLNVIPGTRILQETFGILGWRFDDPKKRGRIWTVQDLYAPLVRKVGGIRAAVADQKGFISFCNQRDLELLLLLAQPGQWCVWLGAEYPGINDPDFFGVCTDPEEARDDLFERELNLRAQLPGVLPYGTQITRRIHLDYSCDVEELDMVTYDCNPETGYGPDTRLETIDSRWVRVERNPLQWERI